MNNKLKVWLILILFVVFVVASFMFLTNKLYNYLIISGVISVILFIVLIVSVSDATSTPIKKYRKRLNRVVKSYKPILIKTDNTPEIDDKCILRISDFEDLIDAQAEIRKPIFYVSTNDSTAFYLIDETVCVVYLLKADEDVVSPMEVKIREQELKNNYDALNLDKLTNIEKTLVLNYKDKAVKISPVRDKEEKPERKLKEVVLKEEEPMIYRDLYEDDKDIIGNNSVDDSVDNIEII